MKFTDKFQPLRESRAKRPDAPATESLPAPAKPTKPTKPTKTVEVMRFVQIVSATVDHEYHGTHRPELVLHALDESGRVWRLAADGWEPLTVERCLRPERSRPDRGPAAVRALRGIIKAAQYVETAGYTGKTAVDLREAIGVANVAADELAAQVGERR